MLKLGRLMPEKQSVYSQGKTLSTLVIQANTIYLSAVISDFIFQYSENIREDLNHICQRLKIECRQVIRSY